MGSRFYTYDDKVLVTIATAQAVTRGDMVGLSSDTLVRAEDETWTTDLATTQRLFASKFLGVSEQTKNATDAGVFGNGSDNTCLVHLCGIYEFDCASASFAVGDLVGPAKQTGNALESQKVVAVASEDLAIGRVFRSVTSATKVLVKVFSRLMPEARSPDLMVLPNTAQSLSGAGAINVTSYLTKWTTTGADAGTLADGLFVGQLKKIQLIVDGGDGTLTPSNLSGGTTITFADAGDVALLMWDGSNWVAIELSNDADGATAPVLA